jgi:hypothetical protein
LRLDGRERGELNAAIQAASEVLIVELARLSAVRLREASPAGRAALRREFEALRDEAAAALGA